MTCPVAVSISLQPRPLELAGHGLKEREGPKRLKAKSEWPQHSATRFWVPSLVQTYGVHPRLQLRARISATISSSHAQTTGRPA